MKKNKKPQKRWRRKSTRNQIRENFKKEQSAVSEDTGSERKRENKMFSFFLAQRSHENEGTQISGRHCEVKR